MRDVFLTLDRSLVAAGGSSASLFDRVLAMVGAGLRQEGALRERLIAGIEAELGRDREGTLGDRRLVRALTKMLSQLGLYVEEVERRVLSQARGYYRSLGMREMGEGRDVGAYLEMAEGRLGEEEGRGAGEGR